MTILADVTLMISEEPSSSSSPQKMIKYAPVDAITMATNYCSVVPSPRKMYEKTRLMKGVNCLAD